MDAVVIARAALADALPLCLTRLCCRNCLKGKTGVVRAGFSNAQRRQKEDGEDGKRQSAAFHGSPPLAKLVLKA
jgi:hypothetical protein